MDDSPSDWMNYIYQYTLNKNFPEATSITFIDKLAGPCELYLEYLENYVNAQKNPSDESLAKPLSYEFFNFRRRK